MFGGIVVRPQCANYSHVFPKIEKKKPSRSLSFKYICIYGIFVSASYFPNRVELVWVVKECVVMSAPAAPAEKQLCRTETDVLQSTERNKNERVGREDGGEGEKEGKSGTDRKNGLRRIQFSSFSALTDRFIRRAPIIRRAAQISSSRSR